MSKLVNWGHLLVAAYFAFWGVDLLWSSVSVFPRLLRDHPHEITYILVMDAIVWVWILLCAWGILKWQRWAQKLGVALSVLMLLFIALAAWTAPQFGVVLILEFGLVTIIAASVLAWLLLPAVRAEYLRRNQPA